MSKQKTLFSFFKKIPSTESDENKSNDVTPIQSPVSQSPKAGSVKRKLAEFNKPADELTIYSMVWAKLDGYPWWPGIICQDPDSEKHLTKTQVHVQFFDKPPSRSWINRKSAVVPYTLKDDEKRSPKKINQSEKEKLKIACEEADVVFKMDKDDRSSCLVDFSSSTNEDDPHCTDKENTDPPSPKMAKMLNFDSEDSEDDYKPDKTDHESEEDELESIAESEQSEPSISDDEITEIEAESGKKRKRVAKTPTRNKKPKQDVVTPVQSTPHNLSSSTIKKISAFKSNTQSESNESKNVDGNWPHLKLPFLQPEKIMDKNKRRPDDPEYDQRTLYVPEDFKNQCSPGMRQWWELKSDHYDCVLFFKVGKFYELYHMDAVLGVNELSLSLMRGEFAHSGFPEIAYGRFSTILVQKGYRVARVEQMETPEMMAERVKNKKSTKFDKVVQREVCQVSTKGTISHNVMDGDAVDPQANYLLALTEKEGHFGVCFIDASIGVFHIGQFEDDKYLSRLRTLFSHCSPVEIIYEKKEMTDRTMQLLNSMMSGVLQQPLQSETEFWSASKTLNTLATREELKGGDRPKALDLFISPNDALGLTPSDNGHLALRALGASIGYLERTFLDSQLLALKQFQIYDPVDANIDKRGHIVILDDITLTNLEVLKNSLGGTEGTLLSYLDRCSTFPGKRLLRQWLCAPLCDVHAIKARQAAVEELIQRSHINEEIRTLLKTMPDLERLLAKIHSQGNLQAAKNHPDSRAIFFEEKIYSKRKIQDFLLTLSGFEKLQKAINVLKKETLDSSLLKSCAECPDLSPQLKYFQEAFDHDQARAEGNIVPKSTGVDPEYDAAIDQIKKLEKEMQDYLKKQSYHFGVQVKYFGTDKNRFQLEMAEGAAKKAGSEYEFTTARKGFKRFHTRETRDFLKRQLQAEEARTTALRDLRRRIFAQFGDKYENWNRAVSCMAQLDVLISMADYARSETDTCIPEFVTDTQKPFIAVESGRHPCIPVADGFIPNSTQLGINDWQSLVVLTGPNMGGKSTLLRQLGLHVIMAHVGFRLAAISAKLSPVDRVFTRIGAGDDILAGESTFFQELNETGLIIQHATKHSLVLVDELGRGTSTYDGTAIAHAVLTELIARNCRTLFSTHYHALVEELQNAVDRVSLGHMACLAEGESITFLYQFTRGACPSSHGFHAARLAGLPETIIQLGQQKAEQLAKEGMRRNLFRKLVQMEEDSQDLSALISAIESVL